MDTNFKNIIDLFENHKAIINNAFKDIKIFIGGGITQGKVFKNSEGCNSLKTIQLKDLNNWDVRERIDPLKVESYRQYGGSCGLTYLLVKVEQMQQKNNLQQLIKVLRRCAFEEPRKVNIVTKYGDDGDYGNVFDEEKTERKSYGREFYKQEKPPKGHFRIRGNQIVCLKPHEQKYLQKFFE